MRRARDIKRMNRMQIAVLGVTVVAFGAAYVLFNSASPPSPPPHAAAPKIETDQVLVAAQEIGMGAPITDASIAWQVWPKAAVSELMIAKSSGPNAMEDVKGSLAREAFIRGEPMRRDKLVKAGANGFMSAILPSGMRAVAIKIDNAGDSYAGGFILPNDRVDVIAVFHDAEATKAEGAAVMAARTILANVRVLAIGQNIEDENGKKVVTGANATLELDPAQAELIVLAQQAGNSNLHLVLRSLADSGGRAETLAERSAGRNDLTIVRFGASQAAAR
jgi:pilus assembly protein CpaB